MRAISSSLAAKKVLYRVCTRSNGISAPIRPLTEGKVIRRVFSDEPPKYRKPSFYEIFRVQFIWYHANWMPHWAIFGAFIWACHGGFTGHLPPDPHELYN